MSTPLFFYSQGACSFGGMVVLEWLALPYQLCRVDPALRATDAFKRVNPQGKVGALKVDDHVLSENLAILCYLAWQKPEAGFMPDCEAFEYNVMNQWFSYLASGFHVAFGPLFGPGKYIEDEKYFDLVSAAGVKSIRKQYEFMNAHLAKNEYILGKQKTILDPYFYGLARWGGKFFDIQKEYPNVARHMALMEKDPAVQFALATEKGEDAKSPSGAFKGHVDLEKVG